MTEHVRDLTLRDRTGHPSTLSKLQRGISDTESASHPAALMAGHFGMVLGGHQEFARLMLGWWRGGRYRMAQ